MFKTIQNAESRAWQLYNALSFSLKENVGLPQAWCNLTLEQKQFVLELIKL